MKVEFDGKVHEFDRRMSVARLLETLSLSREAHLVVSNGTLLTEDCALGPGDDVKIIRVISGG
jgi:sulfur carrier protein ThiS